MKLAYRVLRCLLRNQVVIMRCLFRMACILSVSCEPDQRIELSNAAADMMANIPTTESLINTTY